MKVSTCVQTTTIYQDFKLSLPAARKFNTPVWWNNTILEDDDTNTSMSNIPPLRGVVSLKSEE
jgi:hypothetical protein